MTVTLCKDRQTETQTDRQRDRDTIMGSVGGQGDRIQYNTTQLPENQTVIVIQTDYTFRVI